MVPLGLTDVCKKFYFDNICNEELIFVSQDKVFKFNFEKLELKDYYDFKCNLMA